VDERLEEIREREEAQGRIWAPAPDEWHDASVRERMICTAAWARGRDDGKVRQTCILTADVLADGRLRLTVWPWRDCDPVATARELLRQIRVEVAP